MTDTWQDLVTQASSGMGWGRETTWAAGPTDLAGAGGALAGILATVPTGRLIVLGDRGAGKTMLMVRLVLDLLQKRAKGTAVPVLVSMATWNPRKDTLFSWLETRLIIDYPALAQRSAFGRPTHALALLKNGLLTLVLDGLDELPKALRGLAISSIDEALAPGVRLVLTCRTNDYREAVQSPHGAEVTLRAAAVQLNPLKTPTISSYLRADSPSASERWAPVIGVLDTDQPVAQALKTPLMVWLARVIYSTRPMTISSSPDVPNPAELLSSQFRSKEDVQWHLLDSYIRAAYRPSPGTDPRWKANEATPFLVFLARRLGYRTGDIAWWNLTEIPACHQRWQADDSLARRHWWRRPEWRSRRSQRYAALPG